MAGDDIDFYIGDIERGVYPAGSTSTTPRENRWFGITHLREVSFYRREGMPVPHKLIVDASAIKADERVNEVYISGLYRQHMITGVEEGPTLQKIAPVNVMITRTLRKIEDYKGKGHAALVVDDAYMFLSKEDFIRAYMETNPGSDISTVGKMADAELAKNPKGIFCAIRFKTPVTADVQIPLHGHPLYVTGELERLGYPATVNGSRETEDVAYDKSVYPMIYDEDIGSWVQMPGEMDFRREMALGADGQRISDKDLIHLLRKGNKEFAGFEKFIAKYGEIIIKAGSQSGGRMTIVCSNVEKAVEFLKRNVMADNFAIQFYIRVSPGMILTPEAVLTARERLAKKGLAVDMQRTKTYFGIFARSIAISDRPENPHKIFHHLFGISVDKVGNVGRGGIIEEMLARYFDERLRSVVYRRIAEHARLSMQDFGNFLKGPYLETYKRERQEEPRQTITGIP
ncbi:MAG TPA: hypothetical protein PLV52_06745, partial [Candidatus Omnitrophota bacterium]|nr:hypothetical protein [Candidatus Omnitrophota bacterium]